MLNVEILFSGGLRKVQKQLIIKKVKEKLLEKSNIDNN